MVIYGTQLANDKQKIAKGGYRITTNSPWNGMRYEGTRNPLVVQSPVLMSLPIPPVNFLLRAESYEYQLFAVSWEFDESIF